MIPRDVMDVFYGSVWLIVVLVCAAAVGVLITKHRRKNR